MTAMAKLAIMAGFECSSHRRSDGTRVDVLADTQHIEFAAHDYRLLRQCGMQTAREGLRWHVIEPQRGKRDWDSYHRLADAAREGGISLIWDVLHFGFPDWVNPFHPDFPKIFADFAGEFAMQVGWGGVYVPVNEISFMTWAAGDVEYMYPYSTGRGKAMKRALCSASIAASTAIRANDPGARILAVEPMVAVYPNRSPQSVENAKALHEAQFEAFDMLLGNREPELGGRPELIDMIGVNHYPYSQWIVPEIETGPPTLAVDELGCDWRGGVWSESALLLEQIWLRYRKPILMAETGCEGADRADWFEYIVQQCEQAVAKGVPITGVCLYPILSHIAWTGERYCPNGLFDGTSPLRSTYRPLMEAIESYLAVERDLQTGKVVRAVG